MPAAWGWAIYPCRPLLAGAPEETRTQVLGLLARLIARGALAEDLAAEAGER